MGESQSVAAGWVDGIGLWHGMADIVICTLLNAKDKRVERHHVRLYPRKCCSVCRGEVVVTKEIWLRARVGEDLIFICEQCSLLENSD
jgi:hypothetical protein